MLLRFLFFGAVLVQLIAATGDVEPGSAALPSSCSLDCTPDTGEKGFPGKPGSKGEQGAKGHSGPPGFFPLSYHWHTSSSSGPPGPPGDDGDDGPPGERGPTGRRGFDGQPGRNGRNGLYGPPGSPGDAGSQGPDGAKGPNGEPGQEGESGQKGRKGSRGERGEKGERGVPGDDGASGPPGNVGEKGPIGNSGPKGDPGEKGEKGFPYKGDQIANATVANAGETGPKGFQGPIGVKGAMGEEGSTGQQGEAGENISNTDNVLATPCDESNEGQIHHDPTTGEILFCDGSNWKCAEQEPCDICVPGERYEDRTVSSNTPLRQAADIVLIVDDSGSMRSEQGWIPAAVSALDSALRRGGIGSRSGLNNQYFVVLFGNINNYEDSWRVNRTTIVSVDGDVALSVSQVPRAMEKFRRNGNAEDGYMAIEYALNNLELRTNDTRVALNVGLISDEPRDPYSVANVGTPSAARLNDIRDLLLRKGAKMNVFGNFDFQSDAIDDVVAVDYTGKLYSGTSTARVDTEGFLSESVKVTFFPEEVVCRAFVQYAPLAMETDGAVWSLLFVDQTENDDTLRNRFTAAVARIKVLEIVNQTVCVYCTITCEDGVKKEECSDDVDQVYCRCRAIGRRPEQCNQRRVTGDLQTVKYDYSPMYQNCIDHDPSYPTRYNGWCDPNWPLEESRFEGKKCPP